MALPSSISTSDLAALLNITSRRVQQLAADGVITRCHTDDGTPIQGQYSLPISVHAYIASVKDSATNTEGEAELTELKKENLRLRNRQAELAVGNMEGELHHTAAVQRIMDDMNVSLRQRALAIPNNIARMLVGQSDMVVITGILEKAINDLLIESKQYALEDFIVRNQDFVAPFEFNLDLAQDADVQPDGDAK